MPRVSAQRPLPSMMIATWSLWLELVCIVNLLDEIEGVGGTMTCQAGLSLGSVVSSASARAEASRTTCSRTER